jgi:hypothetical protein
MHAIELSQNKSLVAFDEEYKREIWWYFFKKIAIDKRAAGIINNAALLDQYVDFKSPYLKWL